MDEQPPPRPLSLCVVHVENSSRSLLSKCQDFVVFSVFHRLLSKRILKKEQSLLSSLAKTTQQRFDKITVSKCFVRNEDCLKDLAVVTNDAILIPDMDTYTAKMLSKHKVPNCIVHDSNNWQMYDRLNSKVDLLEMQFSIGQKEGNECSNAIPHIPALASLQVRGDPSKLDTFFEAIAASASLQQQEQMFMLKDEFGSGGTGNRVVSREELLRANTWEDPKSSFVVQPYYAKHTTWAADILAIHGSVRGGIVRATEPMPYKLHLTGCMARVFLPNNNYKGGDEEHKNKTNSIQSDPMANNIWMHVTEFCRQHSLSGNYHFEFLEPSSNGGAQEKANHSPLMLMEINPRVSGVAVYHDASGHFPWIDYSLLVYVRHFLLQMDNAVDGKTASRDDPAMEEGDGTPQWDLFDGSTLKKPAFLPEWMTSFITTCCMPASLEHIVLHLCLVLVYFPLFVSYFLLLLSPMPIPHKQNATRRLKKL